MTNTAIYMNLINGYEELAYTDQYIFGFTDRHNVYASFATSTIIPYICTLDKDSSNRTGGYSLRFKPNKEQKEALKMQESFILCSESYFEECFKNSKYNRGEIFEKLVTEHYGQEWKKDNVPFTEDGDLTINGIPYQLKYQKATFCTESSLHNLKEKSSK